MENDLFKFRKVWRLTPFIQVCLITFILILTIFHGYIEFQKTGLTQWWQPVNSFIYFAPVYEEVIFRGFILGTLLRYVHAVKVVLYSSLLFGIWHLKSIFSLNISDLLYQIAYTGIFFGPILAYVTLKTKTIWVSVILHSLNNFLSPISWVIIWYMSKML